MQIPFQYSLHILHEDGRLEHKEFLGDENSDPRDALINQMLNDIYLTGSIMAYNQAFEITRIKELANYNIERKNELKRDEEFEFYISSDEFKRNIFFKDGKNLEFKIRYQSILGDVKEDFYKFKIIEKDGEYKYMPASLSKRNHATKRFY